MYGKVVWERAMWGLVGEMESNKESFWVYICNQFFYTASMRVLKHKIQQPALRLTWKHAWILDHARRHDVARLPTSPI